MTSKQLINELSCPLLQSEYRVKLHSPYKEKNGNFAGRRFESLLYSLSGSSIGLLPSGGELSLPPGSDADKLITVSILEGLEVLGASGRDALIAYVRQNYKLSEDEIPEHIDVFVDAMRYLFGSGSRVIELQAVKMLEERIRGHPKLEGLIKRDLSVTVKLLRKALGKKKRTARHS